MTDSVYVAPIGVDVDVDSDNDSSARIPSRSIPEELVEDGSSGVVVQTSFDTLGTSNNNAGPGRIISVGLGQHTPVVLDVDMPSTFDLDDFTFTLDYDDSTLLLYAATGESYTLLQSGMTFSSATAITPDQLRSGVTVYCDGIRLGSDMITLTAQGHGKTFDDKAKVTVALDLDTDSNNDGIIQSTDNYNVDGTAEDMVEHSLQLDNVGKRIFVNMDDDNKNGVADAYDSYSDYENGENVFSDNDFAEVQIAFHDVGVSMDALEGYELWLGCSGELNIYANIDMEPLDVPEEQQIGGWYKWIIGDEKTPPPSVFVEGVREGHYDVYWRLVKSGGSVDSDADVLARDTVEISVEKIVWPANQQIQSDGNPNANWQLENTEDWEGFALTEAWHIDKALVDYIMNPGNKGSAATVHPNANNGTACSTGAPLSPINGDYNDFASGFTMEFDYAFDTQRGDGTTGWVEILKDGNLRKKISNVGNSGVKFGTATNGKPLEAAIIDVNSMATKSGGLTTLKSYLNSTGMADFPANTYEDEPLNKLMTGVLYGGDYGFEQGTTSIMTDWPKDGQGKPLPESQANYQTALQNNLNHANSRMKIDVTRTSTNPNKYRVEIFLNGNKTYEQTDITLTSLDIISLQSHWGSGVVFSDMSITKKA